MAQVAADPSRVFAWLIAKAAAYPAPVMVVQIVGQQELLYHLGREIGIWLPRVIVLAVPLPAHFEAAGWGSCSAANCQNFLRQEQVFVRAFPGVDFKSVLIVEGVVAADMGAL